MHKIVRLHPNNLLFFFLSFVGIATVLLHNPSAGFPAERKSESAVCRVTANGYDAGEFFVDITDNDDVLVNTDFLTELRLKKKIWSSFGTENIPLSEFAPRLSYSVDRTEAALVLDIQPQWFEIQEIEGRELPPPAEIHPIISGQPLAAFLNYSLNIPYQTDQNPDQFTLPLEAGVNYENWHLFNSFQTSCSNGNCDFSRLTTRLTGDVPGQLRRWIIGDINPSSSLRLQNSRAMGGISLESTFKLDRTFNPYPTARLDTLLETSATAELIRNGQIVKEWELLPGAVRFDNIVGSGDDTLILRDAFGREQHLELPALLGGQTLLRKEVHEFSYNLGILRNNLGQDNENYSCIAATGLHRYGINDWFTPGIGFFFQKDSWDAGATSGLQFGNHNWLNLEALYRNNKGVYDYGIVANYSLTVYPVSLFLSLQYTGKNFFAEYFSDAETETRQHLRSNAHATARFNSRDLGSFSLGMSSRDYWTPNADRSTSINFTYSRGITKYFSLSAGIRHPLEGSDSDDVLFVGLTFIPGKSRASAYIDSASYHYDSSGESDSSHKLTLQKSAGMAAGTGYSLNVSRNENNAIFGGKYIYRNNSAIITGSLNQPSEGTAGGSVGIAGSIVTLDKEVYFGRPVTDGFTVVKLDKIEDLDNVPIHHNNALAGRLAPGNSLVVPGVLSQQENEISLHSAELPINFVSIDEKKYIRVGNRGGAAVQFTATKFTAVEGNVYFETADDKKEELNSLPMELAVKGETQTVFIGLNGYFYIENLPPGDYVLHVLRFEGNCEAQIRVNQSDDIVASLGRIACHPLERK